MISFLLFNASFLNLIFYFFAIGFVVSLLLEQIIKAKPLSPFDEINDRNIYIVQSNRKYCWRQAWITNACWFLCNVGLYIVSKNMQSIQTDTFWNGI